MTRWLMLLGGLLIWALHFLGVYIITSVADVVATSDAPGWRIAGVLFSASCIAAEVGLAAWVLRTARQDIQPPASDFERALSIGGCVLGGVGILFQTLPLLL